MDIGSISRRLQHRPVSGAPELRFPDLSALPPSRRSCLPRRRVEFLKQNGQDSVEEERQSAQEGRQEQPQEARGDLLQLHLQGAQAGPPGHRHLQARHEHHELLHQRHLRAHRHGGRKARALQQEGHAVVAGDPDRRAPHVAGRAREARSQ
eukprot:scaffold69_cov248-Pinguiococcus_pyrenoidosus.AAC.77